MKRLPASLALLLLCGAARRPELAITIDDLPVHAPYPPGLTPLKVSRKMIAALKAGHAPATTFVNGAAVQFLNKNPITNLTVTNTTVTITPATGVQPGNVASGGQRDSRSATTPGRTRISAS